MCGAGRECYSAFEPAPGDVAEAARRLTHDFVYVGLTDEWEASVLLFHATLGGQTSSLELLATRSTHSRRFGESLSARARGALARADAADVQLHATATAIFEERLRAHGIARRGGGGLEETGGGGNR